MIQELTSDDSAMPVPIAIAVPDDACLHKGAVACHRYGAHVVVAQMEMPLRDEQPLTSCTIQTKTCSLTTKCGQMLEPLEGSLDSLRVRCT